MSRATVKKVFRIFLSSTAEDLRSYRQVAADTVERLNAYPIRMETMGAGPRAPLEECRRQAAEADALIVVAAHRYGWIPPGQEKSITWLEVEAAEAAGRPIFAYLVDPAFPWPHGKEQDALLEASPEDLSALLSLLRRTSSAILSRMWETGDVRGRLRNLGRRYSLVGDGDLHATVREYLRRRWRGILPGDGAGFGGGLLLPGTPPLGRTGLPWAISRESSSRSHAASIPCSWTRLARRRIRAG